MDIRAVKERYRSRLCVLGNVNVDTLARGTPEDVIEEVLACCEMSPQMGVSC